MQETINQRIFHYRKLAGLTQAEVAQRMGMKPSTYAQMERKGSITTDKLIRVSEIIGVEPEVLLNGKATVYSFSQAPAKQEVVLEVAQSRSDLYSNSSTTSNTYTPTNRELAAMKTVHYLPKSVQEEIYAYIEQKYKESK